MPIFLEGRTCILWAALLLTVPLPWLAAAIAAALFHELCHLLALVLTGSHVHSIQIGFRGTKIVTGPLDPKRELLCAAAGPLGSLLLLLFLRQIPRIALCASCQGAFNLLPFYPLDGGRILRSLTAMKNTLQSGESRGTIVLPITKR